MPRAPDSARVLDVEALFTVLDKRRRSERLSWRDVGAAAGCSASLFTRMALDSSAPDAENLCRLLLWLGGTDVKPYLREVPDGD